MHHLDPVPDPPEEDEEDRLGRPPWWRWVAFLVIAALVIATPFAYALSRLLR